ncbi:MAG TPA: hypothetical protein VGJ21_08530 [Terracidiphilus sp.]|jgi:hypothetical protein
MKTLANMTLSFFFMVAPLLHTPNLLSQETESDQTVTSGATAPVDAYGTTAYTLAPNLTGGGVIGPLKPTTVVKGASYATGGVALRNRNAGNIGVSGLVGAPRVTYLYWAVITLTAPPAAVAALQIERLDPVPVSAVTVIKGVVVGTGPAPCWGPQGSIITVFRGVVPAAVSTGDGSYQITIMPGGASLVNGADPWKAPNARPLWEGASLVMIGQGTGTVSVFDMGLAGHTFAPNPNPFNYILALPVVPSGKRMLLDNIGADGQHPTTTSRDAALSISDEATSINGVPVAGPGSDYVDSDWNGSSGLPLPELWDDTGHDITQVNPNGGNTLDVVIKSALAPADCLTPVANIVEED